VTEPLCRHGIPAGKGKANERGDAHPLDEDRPEPAVFPPTLAA
jgi:hypothetical protein